MINTYDEAREALQELQEIGAEMESDLGDQITEMAVHLSGFNRRCYQSVQPTEREPEQWDTTEQAVAQEQAASTWSSIAHRRDGSPHVA